MNRKTTLGALSIIILLEILVPLACAALAPSPPSSISVAPGTIPLGAPVAITVFNGGPGAAQVILKVTDPYGSIWAATMVLIPAGSAHTWWYPDNFPAGASTDIAGWYDVNAYGLVPGNAHASFQVWFFVVPEIPLGILMATIASFAAWGVLKKTKARQ
jgi:hypothetical protein